MNLLFLIASRWFRSKRSTRFISLISSITVGGIALGVAVVLIALTILRGFDLAISEKIISLDAHIVISGFSDKNLPNPGGAEKKINRRMGEHILEISPFIRKSMILRSKMGSEGISVSGVELSGDNFRIGKYIVEKNIDNNNSWQEGLLVGKRLAEKLNISLNDKIILIGLRNDQPPGYNNPPLVKQLKVTAIYESGMAEYDEMNVYAGMNILRSLYDMNDEVSGFNVRLSDPMKADSLRQVLQSSLGYPFYVRTIFDIHKNIFTWIELQKAPIPLILGLIILVSAFNIVGTVLTVVLEKTTSIGILKSLGLKSTGIVGIFLFNGIILCLWGLLIGNGIALLFSYLQSEFHLIPLPANVYFISYVPIDILPVNYLLVSSITFVVSMLTSFIPAYIASKLKPVNALRFG